MAFFRLILTAIKLKHLQETLVEEKQESIKLTNKPEWKWRHFGVDVRLKLKKCIRRIFCVQENSRLDRFCFKLRHNGTLENFLLKSVLGFASGYLLTYIFFIFFVVQLNFSLPTATVFCSILGAVLTVGLAFSSRIRCIVLLTLPQFFSKKGRQALLAYAFILAITGPGKNTLNNISILSESLACGQEQLKSAVKQIIEVVKKPFYAIKEAIKKVVQTVKEIVKKIKEVLLQIKRIIMALVKVIKAAFEFLGKILNVCNKELGTPFERCSRVFENAILDCNAALGPLFNWLCSLTYLVKSVCYLVKPFDFVCMIVDFISNSVIGVIVKKVKTFIRHIKTMFYVRIKFSHSFHYENNATKTLGEISADIVHEIKNRTRMLKAFFDFITSASTMFFAFIIFRVCYYRYKFLTNDQFDNKYINKDFVRIDLKRAQIGRETILPLNSKESNKYVRTNSMKLIDTERKELSKSMSTLGVVSVKLAVHMAADYCLYWILNLIRYYAKFQSKVKAPNIPMVFVKGDGFLADLLKSIVKAFQPLGLELEIDTIPCLPTPIPPDFDKYLQIAIVLVICLFLTMLEPYGLRFRNIIMCYYYPLRGKQRAIWLYNNMIRKRSSFLKFARRQLRRKFFGSERITKVTFKEFLVAKSRCLRFCFDSGPQTACVLCGEIFREADDAKPIYCQTPGCPGVYCEKCFAELKNLCTVCLAPVEYGDLSDISEEKDSSDEEEEKRKKLQKKASEDEKGFHDKRMDDDDDDPGRNGDGVNFDSDYSSGEATDLSYTYQEERKTLDFEDGNLPSPRFLEDVEQQTIPDYASMESFHESEKEIADHQMDGVIEILAPRRLKSYSSLSILRSKSDLGSNVFQSKKNSTPQNERKKSSISIEPIKRTRKTKNKKKMHIKGSSTGENEPLLNAEFSDSDDDVKVIKKFEGWNDGSMYSSVDSDIKVNLQKAQNENKAPITNNNNSTEELSTNNRLKFSDDSLEKQNVDTKSKASDEVKNVFYVQNFEQNVKVDYVSEKSKSTLNSGLSTSNSTLDDSFLSIILKKKSVSEPNLEKKSKGQHKRKIKRKLRSQKSRRTIDLQTSSSTETNTTRESQRNRAADYYKRISKKRLNSRIVETGRDSNRNKVMKFLQKLCQPFTRKKASVSTNCDELELLPYNKSENTWNSHCGKSSTLFPPSDSSEISSLFNYDIARNFSKFSYNPKEIWSPTIFHSTPLKNFTPSDIIIEELDIHMIENLNETPSNQPIIIRQPAEKENSDIPLKRTTANSALDIQELPEEETVFSEPTNKQTDLIDHEELTSLFTQPQFVQDSVSDHFRESQQIITSTPLRFPVIEEEPSSQNLPQEKNRTISKINKNSIQTNTSEPLNSKKSQVYEEEIDYYNSLFKPCMCIEHKDKEIAHKMHCCDCCPEKEDSHYTRPYSRHICKNNQGQYSNKKYLENDTSLETVTRHPMNNGKLKDNCTQTYVPKSKCYKKCNCHCGDCNDFHPKSRKSPKRHCQTDDEDYFHDLQYQNHNDYYELVQELEDTLVNRNRNRVRRAMHEFEQRSRLNRPLERPITNYDEPSDSEECVLRKLTILRANSPKEQANYTCKCERNAYPQNAVTDNCYRSPRHYEPYFPEGSNERNVDKVQKCRPKKTHWQLNPRTGEWFKVDDNFACGRPHQRRSSSPRSTHSGDPHREAYFEPDYFR